MTKPRPLQLFGTALLLLLAILATASPATAASRTGWGYADFDGDFKPDLVELRRTYLNVRLSTGNELHLPSVTDASDLGAEIVVVDLDGDNDLDIVIRNRFLKENSDIWLNDGEGFFRKSATRDFSFPFEQPACRQSSLPDPGIAVTVKISNPLGITGDAWFLPPPSSGRALHKARGLYPARDQVNTTQLRGPPIPSFR